MENFPPVFFFLLKELSPEVKLDANPTSNLLPEKILALIYLNGLVYPAPLAKSPKHTLFGISELLFLTLALTYFGSFLFCFMSFITGLLRVGDTCHLL